MESSSNVSKKQKMYHNKSKNHFNQRKKNYLEVGYRGFLSTCNFKEKDCIRECYNILNEYADELYGPNEAEIIKKNDQQQNEDISDALDKIIETTKRQARKENRRFQAVDTGTSNCIFIKTTLPDPVELGVKIVEDIAKTKTQKTRFLLRLIPIEIVCKANLKDIMDAAGPILDKNFLGTEKTYCVVLNKRYNNDINRLDVINHLAELVATKGIKNKVDLKNAELVIIVEVIKGLCCIGVIPNYNKWKKYNLGELANNDSVDSSKEADDKKSESNEVENDSVKNDEET